jgi:hypothetical protein
MIYRDMVIPMGDIDIRDKEEDEVYYWKLKDSMF